MVTIPLCVSYAKKDEARCAGARWDWEQQVWTCEPRLLATDAYARLLPFVPRMYQPDLAPPFIHPWMVPQTLWGKNLRNLLSKEDWDIVRRHAYAEAGNRCRVCGGRGPKWPVEADEAWDYDDATLTHTLKGVIALCPDCHGVQHWGKTMVDGREEEAFAKMMAVNRWSRATAEKVVVLAFEQWEQRSTHTWRSDYSWVTRTHGIQLDPNGASRAEAANRDLIAKAYETDEATQFDSVRRESPPPQSKRKRTFLDFLKALFR
jgi:hypothetical protein